MVDSRETDEQLDDLADSLGPFNRRMILTGAGFSKPWGGFLASELWSVIVSDPTLRGRTETDRILHDDLNFELALARVQGVDRDTVAPEDGQRILWDAVMRAFDIMDRRIARGFRVYKHPRAIHQILQVLASGESKTTCFFTLNQDLLVERVLSTARENSAPAVLIPGVSDGTASRATIRDFDRASFEEIGGRLSYIKIHGSMNWRVGDSDVVVLGGAKAEAINRFPILRMNSAIFRRALKEKDARLLIVGYGFGDFHINQAIYEAVAARNGLSIWVVDPREPKDLKRAIKNGSTWLSVVGHSTSAVTLFDDYTADYELFLERFWTAP